MSGALIKLVVVTIILYCFVGIWSFIPYMMGFFNYSFDFLIDLIKFNIYPVGNLVYVVNYGLILYLVFFYLVKPLIKSN